MQFIKFIILAFFTLISALANADMVMPSDRVQEGISIRGGPSSQSQYLGQLNVGEQLEYRSSVPYWYEVRLANGQPAFVSKAWSIIVPDAAPPAATATYSIDAIDVGTGLAILVQGSDFTVLYDGGSNDDLARGSNNRLLAYLAAAYPNLTHIDHLILSHPHRDHVELLPDVISHYDIGDIWDSGAVNDICGYRAFIEAVAEEGTAYHTALQNYGIHTVIFPSEKSCYGAPSTSKVIALNYGSQIDEQPITLGAGATMRFLHASGHNYSDYNKNSLVVRFDLGNHRALFMGDAEAGSRNSWENEAPTTNSIEGILLACCSTQLRSDVLIAGHHGSRTSSRKGFLDAVQASTFIISSGPTKYGSVTLPDQIVVDELNARGDVFRTDRDDIACASDSSKIGPDADNEAGGCDNIRIMLNSNISANYLDLAD